MTKEEERSMMSMGFHGAPMVLVSIDCSDEHLRVWAYSDVSDVERDRM